jgi:hypothetical protein
MMPMKKLLNKEIAAIVVVLFAFSMVVPALGNIYIPPGPASSMNAYITPTLTVFNSATKAPIGWMYTDGPTYDFSTKTVGAAIAKEDPTVPSGNTLDIAWGTKVTILGFFPGVSVSADQVPPSVELNIMWNGIPNLVTLSLPTNETVGNAYPPTFYPDINTPYQFAFPTSVSKNASYNIWVGDQAYILKQILGVTVPPIWFETTYGQRNGLWFWYTFTPNTGDWIAYDSTGQTKFPPTYDITALLEFGTSQVWTNHVAWDVSSLEIHKDVMYGADNLTINDMITITNVGARPVTGLNVTQTFPWNDKTYINPDYAKACAAISGGRRVGPTLLANFQGVADPSIYSLPAPFNVINPGETIIITMPLNLFNLDKENVTIVFDSMVFGNEIPPWLAPIGLASIVVGTPTGGMTPLWSGFKLGASTLFGEPAGHFDYDMLAMWFVQTPIIRTPLNHPNPVMILDPDPVPLIAGETSVTSADVNLVRQAVVGLGAYDSRMDCNANGKVDVGDLSQYKSAAGM